MPGLKDTHSEQNGGRASSRSVHSVSSTGTGLSEEAGGVIRKGPSVWFWGPMSKKLPTRSHLSHIPVVGVRGGETVPVSVLWEMLPVIRLLATRHPQVFWHRTLFAATPVHTLPSLLWEKFWDPRLRAQATLTWQESHPLTTPWL